jgi:hypothetical protein
MHLIVAVTEKGRAPEAPAPFTDPIGTDQSLPVSSGTILNRSPTRPMSAT